MAREVGRLRKMQTIAWIFGAIFAATLAFDVAITCGWIAP